MAKIADIKSKDGSNLYPRTIASAVAVDGNTLDDALSKKADKSDLVKEWLGTQSEFDTLTTLNENTNYYVV